MSEAMSTVAGNYLGWLLVCAALCSLALLRERVRPVAIVPHAPTCGTKEPVSGWVCTLEPNHERPRHLDEPHGQSFGVAHTTDQGQR